MRRGLVCAMAVAVLAACAPETPAGSGGPACVVDLECPPRARCASGRCVPVEPCDGPACPAAPRVAFVHPVAGEVVAGAYQVEVEASAERGVSSVVLFVDDRSVAELRDAPWVHLLDTAALGDGVHVVRAVASDRAGRTGSAEVSFRVDGRRPALAIAWPAEGAAHGGRVTVAAEPSDVALVRGAELRVDGALSGRAERPPYAFVLDTRGLADGPHALEVRAETLGGDAVVAARSFVADNTPPAISFLSPAEGSPHGASVALHVSARDATGIAALEAEGVRAAGPELVATVDLAARPEGPAELGAVARDAAVVDDEPGGNVARAVLDVRVDRTPPSIALLAPEAGRILRGAVSVEAEATDDVALARVRFSVGGEPLGAPLEGAGPRFEATWDTAARGGRTQILGAVAEDGAGNVAEVWTAYVVDDQPPNVCEIARPLEGARLAGPIDVAVTAGDDLVVAGVELFVDGARVGTATGDAPVVRWDPAGLADGVHELVATCADAAGGTTTSAPRLVVLDTVPPEVTVTSHAPGDAVYRDTWFVATAHDGALELDVELFVDGVSIGVARRRGAWFDFTDRTGTSVVEARAVDRAGNVGVATVPVVIVPPTRFRLPAPHAGVLPGGLLLAAGDVTGDGVDDLVGTEAGDLALAVGRGGTFAPSASLAGARAAPFVAAALPDLDGDGLRDVVAATAGELVSLRAAGAGAFDPATVEPAPIDVAALVAADVDGDGDDDVVAGGSGAADVVWLENEGGLLVARVVGPEGGRCRRLWVVDLDGDGDRDVVAHEVGFHVHLNDGAGALVRQPSNPPPNSSFAGADVIDLEGDGVPELVATRLRAAELVVLGFDGAGDFVTLASYPSEGVGGAVRTADADGDGDPDVLVEGQFGLETWCNEAGVLAREPRVYATALGIPLDVDGDGDADVVQAGAEGVSIAHGASGRFEAPLALELPDPYPSLEACRPLGLAIGGIVGAGGADLATVLTCFRGAELRVFAGMGDERFDGQIGPVFWGCEAHVGQDGGGPGGGAVQDPRCWFEPLAVSIADLDGAHGLDVAIAAPWVGSSYAVLLSDGSGWVHQPVYQGWDDTFGIASGELDPAPGRELVVSYLASDGSEGAAIVDAGGQILRDLGAGAGVRGVAVADVDLDGDDDVVTSSVDPAFVSVQLAAAGGFQAPAGYPGAPGGAFAVADVDGNDLLDLISGADGDLMVHVGDAAQGFLYGGTWPSAPTASDVVPADLNGDGLTDLAVVSRDRARVDVLLGRSQGGFLPPETLFDEGPIALGDRPWLATAGDLDGDGRAELVVSAWPSSELRVYFHEAP